MATQVDVTPTSFELVAFDAAEIAAAVAEAAALAGLDPAQRIEVAIDETTPQARARVASLAPIRLELESGALEDLKRLRQWSHDATVDVVGRLLVRVRDRLDPAFGDPPADADLTLAEAAAWDASCLGRLARAGHRGAHADRRRYHFRLRHGFTDVADAAFDQLWAGSTPSWEGISALSRRALGVAVDAPPVG